MRYLGLNDCVAWRDLLRSDSVSPRDNAELADVRQLGKLFREDSYLFLVVSLDLHLIFKPASLSGERIGEA